MKRMRSDLKDQQAPISSRQNKEEWGPLRFYGSDAVNGADGPWSDASMGSLYTRIGATASIFFKASETDTTQDWVEVASRSALPISLWGAAGDGVTDDTAAFVAAFGVGSTGQSIALQSNAVYKITSDVTVVAGVYVLGNHAKISYQPPSGTTGYCFKVSASNVSFYQLRFDGSSMPTADQLVNFYGIHFNGTALARLANVRVIDCEFDDMEADGAWTAGGTNPSSIGTHAVYAQYCDGVTINNNRMDTLSASAVFITHCTHIRICHNNINDTLWYSINLERDISDAFVFDNTITGTRTRCRYWGASIQTAGNNGAGETIKNVVISKNHCYGKHSYGTVILVSSTAGALCEGNVTDEITSGVTATLVSHVRAQTDAVGDAADTPCTGVVITNNILRAGGVGQRAIYADNYLGSTYATGLTVTNNHCFSPDATHYFQAGVSVHGQAAGYRNITIADNYVEAIPQNESPNAAIGLVATSAAGWVYDVTIRNNVARFIGTADQSWHIGLGIGGYVDRVCLGGNHWKGFKYGARKFTDSGDIVQGLENDIFVDNVTARTLGWTVPTLTVNEPQPSVANGTLFKTANTQATLIANLLGGLQGQRVTIIIADTYTTFDFSGTVMEGNAGVDWPPGVGDHLECVFDGTNWYCECHDNTL